MCDARVTPRGCRVRQSVEVIGGCGLCISCVASCLTRIHALFAPAYTQTKAAGGVAAAGASAPVSLVVPMAGGGPASIVGPASGSTAAAGVAASPVGAGKRRQARALQGLSVAVDHLRTKLVAALAVKAEGAAAAAAAGDGCGGEGGSGVTSLSPGTGPLKLAAMSKQLATIGLCCYREAGGSDEWVTSHGRAAVDELLAEGRECAVGLAPQPGRVMTWQVVSEAVLGELRRGVEEAVKAVADLRTHMREHIKVWATARSAAPPLPPGSPGEN